jgi:hypothetical protein
MDAEAIEALDTRFYYGFAAAVLVGALAVVGLAWVLAPGEVAFFSLVGLPVVLFLGAAAVAVATDQRTEAAGHLLATVGWLLVLGSVAGWTPAVLSGSGVADPLFLAGFALTALGGVVTLGADHGDRLRALVSRS